MYSPPETSTQEGGNIQNLQDIYSFIIQSDSTAYNNLLEYQKNIISSYTLSSLTLVQSTVRANQKAIFLLEQSIQAKLNNLYVYSPNSVASILAYLSTKDTFGNAYSLDIINDIKLIQSYQSTIKLDNYSISLFNSQLYSDQITLPGVQQDQINKLAIYQAAYQNYITRNQIYTTASTIYNINRNTYSTLLLSTTGIFDYTKLIQANSTLSSIIFSNMSSVNFIYELIEYSKKNNINVHDALKKVIENNRIIPSSTYGYIPFNQAQYIQSTTTMNGGAIQQIDLKDRSTFKDYIEPAIWYLEFESLEISLYRLPQTLNLSTSYKYDKDNLLDNICTLKDFIIPNNYSTVSFYSSLSKITTSSIRHHISLQQHYRTIINSASTPISQIQSSIDMYKILYISSSLQVSNLERLYSTNYFTLQYYITRLKETSSLYMLDSIKILGFEVKDLINLNSQGLDVNLALSTIFPMLNKANSNLLIQKGGNPPTMYNGSPINLYTVYNTLNVLEQQYNTAYETAKNDREIFEKYLLNPDDTTTFESFLNTYNDYIKSTVETYNLYLTQNATINAKYQTDLTNYNNLLKTKILDSYLTSIFNQKTNEFNETVQSLQNQIAIATQNVIILESEMKINQGNQTNITTIIQNNLDNKATINGQIDQLNSQIAIINDNIVNYTSQIYNISTLNLSSLNQNITGIFQTKYQNAAIFDLYSLQLYQNLSIQYAYEYSDMIGVLQILSSQMMLDVVDKRSKIAQTAIYNLTTVDTFSTNIREKNNELIDDLTKKKKIIFNYIKNQGEIDGFERLYTLVNNEYAYKQYYLALKRLYENQSYKRIIPNRNNAFILSKVDMKNLEIEYDITTANTNALVSARYVYFSTLFKPSVDTIFKNLAEGQKQYLEGNPNQSYTEIIVNNGVSTQNTINLPVMLPLSTNFTYTYVDQRTNIFVDGFVLPTTTVQICPSTFLQASLYGPSATVTRKNVSTPTTTADLCQYGLEGRYIEISKADNDLEILQVIVIDKNGKNVAFMKKVSINPLYLSLTHTYDLNYITNGNYSKQQFMTMVESMNTHNYTRYMFVSPGSESSGDLPYSKKIIIDLGANYEITAIKYLRFFDEYSSAGMQFRILNEANMLIATQTLMANTEFETLDFRNKSSSCDGPIDIIPTRYGTCGVYSQYIRLLAPRRNNEVLPNYRFIISQIAVIDSTGANVALNKSCKLMYDTKVLSIINNVINRAYYIALPLDQCYISDVIPNTQCYLEIDLGKEYDVTSVHIYNTSEIPDNSNSEYNLLNNQIGIQIQLYTEDRFLATSNYVTSKMRKEIISFKKEDADENCQLELKWPSFYGEAGVIAKYILLTRSEPGPLVFSKVEVIDKSGRDVALFKPVIVPNEDTKGNSLKYIGVGKQRTALFLENCYSSDNSISGNKRYQINLEQNYEICSINIYGCIDVPFATNNIQIDIYDESMKLLLRRFTMGGKPVEKFDLRFNPEESTYPTDLKETINIGDVHIFGTLANTVIIKYTTPVTLPSPNTRDPNFVVTDGTGRNVMSNLIPNQRTRVTDDIKNSRIIVEFGYMADITAVVMNADVYGSLIGTHIQLYDCNASIVNDAIVKQFSLSSTKTSENAPMPTDSISNLIYADFRNISNQNISYAPLVYFRAARLGPFGKGICTKYIRIIPVNDSTPLYISQIIAVDANGFNVALEKDTFTNDITTYPTTSRAVDGIFEANLTDIDAYTDISLYFSKYIQRPERQSFVSNPGAQEDKFWIVDLGDICEINSILYIATNGHNKESQGVIVQLYDEYLNLVGIQQVSNLVSQFGVDILDFRNDRTESYENRYAQLEIRQRVIATGARNCGVMAQYVRIELQPGLSESLNTQIQLSQVIALDPDGTNIALYKPVYYNGTVRNVTSIVDGSYYLRDEEYGFVSELGNITPYIEINFGQEVELVNLYILNLKTNPERMSTMRIKVYNKYRDVIVFQNLTAPVDVNSTAINYLKENRTITTFLNIGNVPLSIIGVKIRDKLMALKISQGFADAGILNPPTIPDIPLNNLSTIVDTSCNPNLVIKRVAIIRDPISKGVQCNRIRIYNVNQYIQISQIMVYDQNGNNVAFNKPCKATSVLPGFYASRITDGVKGYYHVPRSEDQCYISAKKKFDYVDIDLGQQYYIIAVKYVPPKFNNARNVGLQIQLINSGITVAQDVMGPNDVGGKLIDFRPIGTIPVITQLIMPPIQTFGMNFV